MNHLENHLMPLEDLETMQATILAAAIEGNVTIRNELPELQAGLEEPYRTIAGTVVAMTEEEQYVDRLTVKAALTGKRLTRFSLEGRPESLNQQEAMALVFASEASNERAEQYVPLFRQQVTEKRRAQTRARVLELANKHGDDTARLKDEIERLPHHSNTMATDYPSESELFLPFVAKQALLDGSTGLTGLDTGFPLLNEVTNGLDTGMYVVSAPPSVGKTTMVWQICQRVAEINKCPVLFVSMEQSAKELRYKAIARMAQIDSKELHRNNFGWNDPHRKDLLSAAIEGYLKISPYLTVVEGDGGTTVEVIRDIARSKMAELGSKRCLIAIDYLQLLQLPPEGSRVEIRERIDLIVSDLRRLARELDSPVLVISSLNRVGYKAPSIEGFKESGGIEYGADVAIGMHNSEQGSSVYETQGNRNIELHVIKNRNGEVAILNYRFIPQFANFIEIGKM